MTNQYKSQVQHSVPQFVLEEFSVRGQIWVFDKHKDKRFFTNIKNVMSERDYNAVSFNGTVVDYEDRLSRLEDTAAPVLKKIIQKESVMGLDTNELAKLCTFVTAQMLRGASY